MSDDQSETSFECHKISLTPAGHLTFTSGVQVSGNERSSKKDKRATTEDQGNEEHRVRPETGGVSAQCQTITTMLGKTVFEKWRVLLVLQIVRADIYTRV